MSDALGEFDGALSFRMLGEIEIGERPGSGPTLVLLHGIGSNAASFAPLIAALPPTWRVIAWNTPGYGRSSPLREDWPMAEDYADALVRVLDAMPVARAMLLGHSLGALAGAAFAVRHPERVERLILASPALGYGVAKGAALDPGSQSRIDDLVAMGPEAFAAARAPRLIHAPEDHPERLAAVRDAMTGVRLPGYAQAVRMLASGRLLEDVARLSVTTDVVVGTEDQITPAEGARRAYETLPAAARGDYVEIPSVGHIIAHEAPEVVAEALVAPTR